MNDAAGTPRFIETLPRRGYRFIAAVEAAPQPGPALQEPPPGPAASRSYRRLRWAAVCPAIAGALLWFALDRVTPPPPKVIPLTTLTGNEFFPAFSPDGKQVAFTWNGDSPNNFDLYVKMVGEETMLRLTSHPRGDGFAAWSPDGRQIAFTSQRDGGGIYLVSPLGPPDRKLVGFTMSGRPAWSPDGKHLLVAQRYVENKPEPGDGALFLVPVEGGEPRQVQRLSIQVWT